MVPSKQPSSNFSANEIALMHALLQHSEKPKINWAAIVASLGATNERAAKERLRVATSKYGWFGATAETDAGLKTPAPKTPSKKKARAAEEDADGTPSAKKSKKATVADEQVGDIDEV